MSDRHETDDGLPRIRRLRGGAQEISRETKWLLTAALVLLICCLILASIVVWLTLQDPRVVEYRP